MKILTYHGDETLTRLFTTTEKAIDFATDEVADCTGVEAQHVIVHADTSNINVFADAKTVEAVILDQEHQDSCVYTVTDAKVDEEYIPKYGN